MKCYKFAIQTNHRTLLFHYYTKLWQHVHSIAIFLCFFNEMFQQTCTITSLLKSSFTYTSWLTVVKQWHSLLQSVYFACKRNYFITMEFPIWETPWEYLVLLCIRNLTRRNLSFRLFLINKRISTWTFITLQHQITLNRIYLFRIPCLNLGPGWSIRYILFVAAWQILNVFAHPLVLRASRVLK